MKRLATAVGAGALVLALGACGQTHTQISAAGIAPGNNRDVPATQVDASRLPAGYPVRVQQDDTGSVLTVQGEEGGCEKASAELAAQDGSAVHVVLVRTLAPTNQVCSKDLRFKQLTVRLDNPLADRQVVLEQRTVRS
jgi:hypothetical protein